MSHDPETPIDIYVCFGHERGTHYPHWMLMLRNRGSMVGTWIHSTGGPTQNTPYACTIQANKRVNSHGIESTELLGTISLKDVNKVKAAAKRVPPQQCQMYVVTLASELEKKGLLPNGVTARLGQRVRMSETAQGYRRQNPVAKPDIAWYPPGEAAPSWVQNVTSMPTSSGPSHSSAGGRSYDSTSAYGHGSHRPRVIEVSPTAQQHHSSSQHQQRLQRQEHSGGCCMVM